MMRRGVHSSYASNGSARHARLSVRRTARRSTPAFSKKRRSLPGAVPGLSRNRGTRLEGSRYFGPVATGVSAASDHSLKLPS